jgi:hypothetical protein
MTPQLLISPIGQELVSKSILITGLGRSGTTLVGKLIASCNGVEYSFEPPTLVSLFSQLGRLQPESWKLLYATYLYEEVCVNGLAGRSINLNRHDDSSAWKTMGEEEVYHRMSQSWRKHEIESLLYDNQNVHIACKIPNLSQYIPAFSELFPQARILYIVRSLLPTIASFMAKGWFRKQESDSFSTQMYPYSIFNAERIPSWVRVADIEWWSTAQELERCLYYYSLNIDINPERAFRLDYEELVSEPRQTFALLLNKLQLESGKETKAILDTIHSNSLTLGTNSYELIGAIDTALAKLPQYSAAVLYPHIPQGKDK